MITGLFAFDGPMYCDRNGIYCNTTITNEMLNRYFSVVDKLYVLIRTTHIQETYEEARLQKLNLDNIEIVEVDNILSPINYITRRKYLPQFESIVNKCDLIFLRIPSLICNMIANICIKKSIPYLVEVGGCAWDSYWHHGIAGKVCALSMYMGEKKTVKYSSFASYVTEKWLQSRYPTNSPQISASNVYIHSFDDIIVENRIKRMTDPLFKPIRIGTIASVDVRYKGQEFIIKAIGLLKKKGYRFEYDLVGAGNGEYLKKLARRYNVSDQVHFLGLKVHSKIWEWLDTIDIYAQPSKQEGLPRAVIEAMSRGCICIGSTTAGIPELLPSSCLFKNGDVNQICKILLNFYSASSYELLIRMNYDKSKNFNIHRLESLRNELFKKYKNYYLSKRQCDGIL